MNLKNREIQACTIIDGIQDELKSISLFLHNNPELGQQEVRAVQTISRYMEQQMCIRDRFVELDIINP